MVFTLYSDSKSCRSESLCFMLFHGFVHWFMASYLYCFLYSYRSSNYLNQKVTEHFLLLTQRSKNCDNYLESNQERSKELIPKLKQRGLTLQGALEKNPILLSKYWKMNLIISYLGEPITFSPLVHCTIHIYL